MMKRIVLAALFSAEIVWPAFAENACHSRFDSVFRKTTWSAEDHWIVRGEGDACTARRMVSETLECSISIGLDHGSHGFYCGKDLSGVWGVVGEGFHRGALTLSFRGVAQRGRLPSHKETRGKWLAPIDEEGLYTNYPVSGDDYFNCYPRHFALVGEVKKIANPDFDAYVQSLAYVTMKGKKRVAVAGRVSADCQSMYFVTWAAPEVAERSLRDMASFIGNLRLKSEASGETPCKPKS